MKQVYQKKSDSSEYHFSTPVEHYDRLHNDAHGVVILWEKQALARRWVKLNPGHGGTPTILSAHQGGADRYMSVNEFYAWRCIRHLRSLRACFVDIDGIYDFEWVMSAVGSAGLPTPNFCVFSGRGIHLYWQIDPVPASALGVWQRVQNEIVRRLVAAPEALNVDVKVKDCTRVLRLVGSVNSKNGEEVHGRVLTPWQWDLHSLADEVLGPRPAQPLKPDADAAMAADRVREEASIRDFRAARVRAGTMPRTKSGSIYDWWQLVYRDLITIADANLLGIPEGYRDAWLFLYAVALSWFTEPATLASEVEQVAKCYTQGLKIADVRKAIAPVLARAEAARAGDKVQYMGQERDPRYAFRRETLLEWLKPIIPDALYPDLRAIIPDNLRAERRMANDAARWSDQYTGTGVKASNEQNRATARILKAQGRSIREIAAELEVGKTTVGRWLD